MRLSSENVLRTSPVMNLWRNSATVVPIFLVPGIQARIQPVFWGEQGNFRGGANEITRLVFAGSCLHALLCAYRTSYGEIKIVIKMIVVKNDARKHMVFVSFFFAGRGRNQLPPLRCYMFLSGIPRPRPRPGLWGQGRGRGQFLEVEAKAEAKDKVMNKKYQKMMIDSIHRTGESIIILVKTTQFNFSFSLHGSVTTFYVYHCVMSCSRQTDWSVSSWLLVLLLQTEARPGPNVWGQGRGRGQSFEAETEAEAKFWPWPRGGLTSLISSPMQALLAGHWLYTVVVILQVTATRRPEQPAAELSPCCTHWLAFHCFSCY